MVTDNERVEAMKRLAPASFPQTKATKVGPTDEERQMEEKLQDPERRQLVGRIEILEQANARLQRSADELRTQVTELLAKTEELEALIE